MIKVENPINGYEVEVPEEGLDLQNAIFENGSDGRVEICEDSGTVTLTVPAGYAETLIDWTYELIGPAVTHVYSFMFAKVEPLPSRSGKYQDPSCEQATADLPSMYDPERYFAGLQMMLGITIVMKFPRQLLPSITACAEWIAGGPQPALTWRDFQPD